MNTTITRRYSFEAAHWLPHVADGHKCKRVHGHNYECEVTVAGEVGADGFIIDFWDLDKVIDPLIQTVDHRTLNDVAGLENPTAENIAAWFLFWASAAVANKCANKCRILSVRCFETKNCWADVFAEPDVDFKMMR